MSPVGAFRLARITAVLGKGDSLTELATRAAKGALAGRACGAVVAASFSNPERFPALAVRLTHALGLPAETPAFDLQMACSAYPYALYLAGKFAADLAQPVLIVDGDVQTSLVDATDHATGAIFSDAVTATLIEPTTDASCAFSFYSRADDALTCSAAGPIRMDGFKVFTFVAMEVSRFLKAFDPKDVDYFVPHQANPYMVRQLAKTLGLDDRLLTLDAALKNPGSCSIALTLAAQADRVRGARRMLLAGFGAGLSAAAGLVAVAPDFTGEVLS